MLTFISFWRAAAIVLSDLASSAYYVGGDTEKVLGRSAPWFVLAVMLFSYAVRSIYIESSSMFVRGGVYRVVKEAMGGSLAKLSVSALLFDYILTGPISAVSAGQYFGGFLIDLAGRLGHTITATDQQINYFAAVFGCAVTIYFWWKNTQGIHESSEKALWIMKITTVMVVMLIVWCLITLFRHPVALPPLPSKAGILAANEATHGETLGWLSRIPLLAQLPFILMIVGFGHSVLAMSGEESLAQVNREIEHPKLKNLERAGLVIFIYSMLFTSLVSFFAVMIIPDNVRPNYFANLIGGLAMYMAGPYTLRLIFQGFVVLVGALILSGAVNTAIVGANGVLNRISEDGVMTPWFRKPHGRFGTTYRLINLIVGLQLLTIIASRGDVFKLAALYAFGVIWSFAFKALAVFVLRFTHLEGREFRVPGNIRVGKIELPVGLGLITLLLFATALINLGTKPDATRAGIGFSVFFFILFLVSERITHQRREGGDHHMIEQFRVAEQPLVAREEMSVRPGNVLVAIRDPRNLYYLDQVLHKIDTTKQDIVVMTARILSRDGSFGGGGSMAKDELFDEYEQQLFTKVVEFAEKAGKHVSLMVVPTTNVFDGIVQTAQRLESSTIATGISNKLSLDEQGKLTGDAWERLPEPRPRLRLQVYEPNGTLHDYRLGPHTPRLRQEDVDVLHRVWLDVTREPELSSVHHYHIVRVSVEDLKARLADSRRAAALKELGDELHKDDYEGKKP